LADLGEGEEKVEEGEEEGAVERKLPELRRRGNDNAQGEAR
jgi:hypothetical protein